MLSPQRHSKRYGLESFLFPCFMTRASSAGVTLVSSEFASMCAHYAALRDLSVRYRTKAHSWPSALAVALVTGGARSIRDILSLCAPAHRQRTEALLTVVHCARSIDPCISVGPQFQKVR